MQPQPRTGKLPPSHYMRVFWREAEDIMTNAAGPLLILSSLVQAADTYSGHAISARATWLALVWACARAMGTTIWLRPAVQAYRHAQREHRSAFGWGLLILALSLVDIQALLLFGAYAQHITLTGVLGFFDPGPVGWMVEAGLLGIVLIIVHGVIDDEHNVAAAAPAAAAAPTPLPAVHVYPSGPVPTIPAVPAYYEYPGGYPGANRDEYREYTPPAPAAPHVNNYDTPEYRNRPERAVTPRTRNEPTITLTATPRSRSDAGRPRESVDERIQRMMVVLRDNPKLSDAQLGELFGVSPSTAYNNKREARRRMEQAERSQPEPQP